MVWVGIDLSKADIGSFERDIEKRWPKPWPKTRRRARNYDKKEKRKKDYCNPRRNLSNRLLEEPLDIGPLVSLDIGSITPPRRRSRNREGWKRTVEAEVHHTIRDTHHRDKSRNVLFQQQILEPTVVRLEASL